MKTWSREEIEKNRAAAVQALEQTETFVMAYWIEPCGTPRCIGGHAELAVFGVQSQSNSPFTTVDNAARVGSAIGLTGTIVNVLFLPSGATQGWLHDRIWDGIKDPYECSREQGVQALKRACALSDELATDTPARH